MDDADRIATAGKTRRELHEATRISRRDEIGGRRQQRVNLSRKDLLRHQRLGEVVGSRGAAARAGISVLDQLQAGNASQETPRGLFHALAMDQVAGIVVTHARSDPRERAS